MHLNAIFLLLFLFHLRQLLLELLLRLRMFVPKHIQIIARLEFIDDSLISFCLFHPIFVEHWLKQPLHLLLELLVDSFGAYFEVDFFDDLIDEPHDEVIVLSAFSKLEVDCRVKDIVVLRLVSIVDFSDRVVEVAIDLLQLCDWIFGHFVLKKFVLEVFVDDFEVSGCELEFLRKTHNVT